MRSCVFIIDYRSLGSIVDAVQGSHINWTLFGGCVAKTHRGDGMCSFGLISIGFGHMGMLPEKKEFFTRRRRT